MSNDRILRQIKARLSLRPPQADSLDLLDDILDRIAFDKYADPAAALAAIQAAWPSVTDFERDFPSLCFALATGVGKTRLLGRLSAICISAAVREISSYWPRTPRFTTSSSRISLQTPRSMSLRASLNLLRVHRSSSPGTPGIRDAACGAATCSGGNSHHQHFQRR